MQKKGQWNDEHEKSKALRLQRDSPEKRSRTKDRFFILKEGDLVWKYWLGYHEDGSSYIDAIKRIK